jgi:serine protease AprX
VAIVDTGLGWHPGIYTDVNGRFCTRIVAWVDFVDGHWLPRDPNGHGTHIAGIIGNTQKDAGGQWDGVAPGVNLVGVRVLDREGVGTYERVIQGIQWVVAHKDQYNIRVMNLSLISPVQSPYWADPLNQAVMQAWAAGIIVVVASGNSGPGAMSVGVPGNNPYVITVGAFTDNYTPLDWNDDYIAPFSSAGPTLDGFVKPDVVAPGAHIVSTMMPLSYLERHHEANRITPFYFSMAGSSQATAVVSGIAALAISQKPELTPNQVKYRLMNTAFVWVNLETTEALYSMWQQGSGRVNAPDTVYADIVGEANLGMDIAADLAGTAHYEGYSYYDETTGTFRLNGDFNSWGGGYGAWSGGYGAWSGGYGAWSGGYGAWSGGYGAWSGGYGAWSGGYGAWSGGYGAWSGGYGAWSGGYGAWSGGYGAWSGNEPWAGSIFSDAVFVTNFLAGVSPDSATSTTSINNWVEEP